MCFANSTTTGYCYRRITNCPRLVDRVAEPNEFRRRRRDVRLLANSPHQATDCICTADLLASHPRPPFQPQPCLLSSCPREHQDRTKPPTVAFQDHFSFVYRVFCSLSYHYEYSSPEKIDFPRVNSIANINSFVFPPDAVSSHPEPSTPRRTSQKTVIYCLHISPTFLPLQQTASHRTAFISGLSANFATPNKASLAPTSQLRRRPIKRPGPAFGAPPGFCRRWSTVIATAIATSRLAQDLRRIFANKLTGRWFLSSPPCRSKMTLQPSFPAT